MCSQLNPVHVEKGWSWEVQSLSCVWLSVTPWTAARQASQPIANSQSWLKLSVRQLVFSVFTLVECKIVNFYIASSLCSLGSEVSETVKIVWAFRWHRLKDCKWRERPLEPKVLALKETFSLLVGDSQTLMKALWMAQKFCWRLFWPTFFIIYISHYWDRVKPSYAIKNLLQSLIYWWPGSFQGWLSPEAALQCCDSTFPLACTRALLAELLEVELFLLYQFLFYC